MSFHSMGLGLGIRSVRFTSSLLSAPTGQSHNGGTSALQIDQRFLCRGDPQRAADGTASEGHSTRGAGGHTAWTVSARVHACV